MGLILQRFLVDDGMNDLPVVRDVVRDLVLEVLVDMRCLPTGPPSPVSAALTGAGGLGGGGPAGAHWEAVRTGAV